MSIGTKSIVKTPVGLTVVAARIMVILGALHLILTTAINLDDVPHWVSGELWMPKGSLRELAPHLGEFWLTIGSFGLPLILLGAVTAWAGKLGHTPPAFVGWTFGAWAVLAGLILEPCGYPLALIPAAMLIIAARRGKAAVSR